MNYFEFKTLLNQLYLDKDNDFIDKDNDFIDNKSKLLEQLSNKIQFIKENYVNIKKGQINQIDLEINKQKYLDFIKEKGINMQIEYEDFIKYYMAIIHNGNKNALLESSFTKKSIMQPMKNGLTSNFLNLFNAFNKNANDRFKQSFEFVSNQIKLYELSINFGDVQIESINKNYETIKQAYEKIEEEISKIINECSIFKELIEECKTHPDRKYKTEFDKDRVSESYDNYKKYYSTICQLKIKKINIIKY